MAPRLTAWYCTPYGWQPNSTNRRFEYPWAYEQVAARGSHLRVLEVGAGLSGLQFTLARAGHEVHVVDPGLKAKGRGWDLDADLHALLARKYKAPVSLSTVTVGEASLEAASFDVILSVSAVEHFAQDELDELFTEARRLLKPTGVLVLTVDLFLDVEPFTDRTANVYGRNVDLRRGLELANAGLVIGIEEELCGFARFDPERIRRNLSRYLISEAYPALSQCLVAAPR